MAEKEIKTKRSNRQKTLDMVYIAIFAVIIAVCSWISVPMVVPFTLQTFGVFCAVGLLGGKRGTLSVLIYVLLGAVGVPVFAGFSSGIGSLFGVTGGYIMGFRKKALGDNPRNGSRTFGLLCLRYDLVYGRLCAKSGTDRTCGRPYEMCCSVFDTGRA